MQVTLLTLYHIFIPMPNGIRINFSFEAKQKADAANPRVQEGEALMWKFQQALPQAKPGEKWLPMKRIFNLEAPDAISS